MDQRSLNQLVLSLAPAHEARAYAPSTFADLVQCQHSATLPVWDGASNATIFRDAKVNHAFRAWHDATHIANYRAFDLAGEIQTCADQKAQVRLYYPSAPAWVYRLLDVEISEQAAHFVAHGEFPLDQLAFTLERIKHDSAS